MLGFFKVEILFYNLTTDEAGWGGGGWESLVRKNMHQRAKPNFYSTCFGKNTQPSCKTPTNCGGQSLRAEIFILKTEKREKKTPNSTNKKQPT